MKQVLKNIKKFSILALIGFVVIGILLLIFPTIVPTVAGYVIGVLLLCFGVIKIVGYLRKEEGKKIGGLGFAFGIVAAIIGVFIIIKPMVIADSFIKVFGFIILVNGIIKLQRSIDLKRAESKNWWSILAVALVSMALGIFFIANTIAAVEIVTRILGGVLVAVGIAEFWTVLSITKAFKEIVKQDENGYEIIEPEDIEEVK